MSPIAAAPVLLAALLFGATTPIAKLLAFSVSPLLLAGMLYLGSGVGLGAMIALRRTMSRSGHESIAIPRADLPWLAAAIVSGGVIGPALLMVGLQTTDASSASLLLNVEGVLTALIAWVVFRENVDAPIALGMAAIVVGGVLLAWHPQHGQLSSGALLICGACLAWAIDNNLTRKVSANDALLLACVKGLAAGAFNTGLALVGGATLPSVDIVATAMCVGFAGYGLSLVLFVVGLRTLGTARTGAYFSIAPLVGVSIALMLWPERPAWTFWAAAVLMSFGVWLHLRERHGHDHVHEAMEHEHGHVHDIHHQHAHDGPVGDEPHHHPHRHVPVTHRHVHYPDIHHRHSH